MIIRARSVVTMDGPPLANGAVSTAGERIADVGSWSEVRGRNSGEVLDLGECVLLPGLINAHCHLDYTDLRGTIPRQASFADWIRAINARKAQWQEADYARSIENGCAEAARFGTTTIANLEAFPALVGKLPPLPMRIWWFAEMIDVRESVSAAATLAALRNGSGSQRISGEVGLAPHAPYTASAELYREVAALRKEGGCVATTHLAESREEMEMFTEGSGALFELLQSIGRPSADCGGTTPLALMFNRGVLDQRWIVAHLNELTADDRRLLEHGPKFHVVHCPRSHAFFDHSKFPLSALRDFGFNICLGTDSLASNEDLSLFPELRLLAQKAPMLSPREILEMVTTRAAAALGAEQSLGRIRRGHLADMIAIPMRLANADAFETVIAHGGDVPWRMIDGTVDLTR